MITLHKHLLAIVSCSIGLLLPNQAWSTAIPCVDCFQENIAGIDQNGDGVRDDIEFAIAKNGATMAQQAAQRQLVRALTKAMETSRDTPVFGEGRTILFQQTSMAMGAAGACMRLHFGPNGQREIKAINRAVVNSGIRMVAYGEFRRAIAGKATRIAPGAPCETSL